MRKRNNKILVLLLSIILIVIIVFIAKLFWDGKGKVETPTQEEPTQETQTQSTREGMMHSYLTGEWVEDSIGLRRPIAVMLNNIKAGVPQSGISRAEIVYEALAEGGVTRLLGVFENYDDLEKIGSVRSARTYYVYLAQEYEAILLHYGEAHYADSALDESVVSNLSGTTEIGKTVFYRATDKVSPHNAYTSAEGIQAGIKEMNYDTRLSSSYQGHFNFTEDDEQIVPESGTDAVKVVPGYNNNAPWFEYNSSEQKYYRFQFGGEQVDEMDGSQLTYKNIILQYCEYSYYDGNGYLDIDVNGSGSGKYITNGKAVDITWDKDSRLGRTHYYDEGGSEITLNQGKTWVCIILNDKVDNVQILDTID